MHARKENRETKPPKELEPGEQERERERDRDRDREKDVHERNVDRYKIFAQERLLQNQRQKENTLRKQHRGKKTQHKCNDNNTNAAACN